MYVNNFSTGSGETINFMAAVAICKHMSVAYISGCKNSMTNAATNIPRKENYK